MKVNCENCKHSWWYYGDLVCLKVVMFLGNIEQPFDCTSYQRKWWKFWVSK